MPTNDEVIASGGGSPQARSTDECCKGGSCPICNPDPVVDKEDDEFVTMHEFRQLENRLMRIIDIQITTMKHIKEAIELLNTKTGGEDG